MASSNKKKDKTEKETTENPRIEVVYADDCSFPEVFEEMRNPGSTTAFIVTADRHISQEGGYRDFVAERHTYYMDNPMPTGESTLFLQARFRAVIEEFVPLSGIDIRVIQLDPQIAVIQVLWGRYPFRLAFGKAICRRILAG